MTAVVFGLLALGVGPILMPIMRRWPFVAAAIDGFVVVSICGLVLVHIVPQSVALAGPMALVLGTLGFLTPVALHRLDARRLPAAVDGSRHLIAGAVVFVGTFVHALLDGVALVGEVGHDHDEGLPLLVVAVLLHRIPTSLAIWVVGREQLGPRRAVALLVTLGIGTVVGASGGSAILAHASAPAMALVQAFAAGAVLHVLLDAPAFDVTGHPRAASLGVAAGIGILVVLASEHPLMSVVADELDFGGILYGLAIETAPVMVVSMVGLAVMGALASRWRWSVGTGGNRLSRALAGVVAGAPLPVCGCTAVPAFEGLIRRRVSVAASVAFLVSAPELGLPSTLLSFELLGAPIALARIAGAVFVAVTAGIVVGVTVGRDASDRGVGAVELPERNLVASFFAHLEHVAPWFLLGLVLAAFCEPLLTTTSLAVLPHAIEVPVYAFLGLPLYLCGTGSTPLAAVLIHKGASVGAVVAFLLSGPAMNIATVALLGRLVSLRAAVAFAVTVGTAATVVGTAINVGVDHGWLAVPSLHSDVTHAHGWIEKGALAIVVVMAIWALWRQGARGFLGQIVQPLDEAMGGHVHGPHCGHRGHQQPTFGARPPVARVRIDFAP